MQLNLPRPAFAFLSKNTTILLFWLVVSLFLFGQGLNYHGIEYRDDEIFYFNSTREMLTSGNYLSPTYFGEDRFQKPILFYWFILASFKIFGVSWFSARAVSVVFAALTVCLTWVIARELFDKKIATISAMILMTVPLFFRHSKNAVPDMALNFFIVLAIYTFMKFLEDPEKRISRLIFFISCALGFMVKGFAAMVVPLGTMVVFLLLTHKRDLFAKINFPLKLGIIMVIVLPWFLYMMNAHGNTYTDYMLKTETVNRLVSSEQQNIFIKLAMNFHHNFLFYMNTIFSYFAPWSLFIFPAIPLGIRSVAQRQENREGLILMLVWFSVVLLFFCLIHARINHLILVLSTPFAILVGWVLVESFEGTWYGNWFNGLKRFIALALIGLGVLGLSFIRIYLLHSSGIWLLLFVTIFILSAFAIYRSKTPFIPAFILGAFLIFALQQSPLISQARLTAHAVLAGFADTIKKDADPTKVIVVGSHDIHKKEFQAYFDSRVLKTEGNDEDKVHVKEFLAQLFHSHPKVYCLILRRDYESSLKDVLPGQLSIVGEDHIFRRRIYVDRGFFLAILKLDRNTVKRYLMENIILVRKG